MLYIRTFICLSIPQIYRKGLVHPKEIPLSGLSCSLNQRKCINWLPTVLQGYAKYCMAFGVIQTS